MNHFISKPYLNSITRASYIQVGWEVTNNTLMRFSFYKWEFWDPTHKRSVFSTGCLLLQVIFRPVLGCNISHIVWWKAEAIMDGWVVPEDMDTWWPGWHLGGGKSRGEGGTVTATSGVSNEVAYALKCTAGQVRVPRAKKIFIGPTHGTFEYLGRRAGCDI